MPLSTATELMLPHCCAPAFNRAKPNSTSCNDIQFDSKLFATWTHLGFLGLFLFSNPRRSGPSALVGLSIDHKPLDVLWPESNEVQHTPVGQ